MVDVVCFFHIGFLLIPCKVPFENAVLLGYAWGEKRTRLLMFCLLVPRPEGKGGVIFYCNLYFIPHKGLLAELTFSIFESSNKKKFSLWHSAAFLSGLSLIHLRIHIFGCTNSCLILLFIPIHPLSPVIGIPGRLNFQTQVRNQGVVFHLWRCFNSLSRSVLFVNKYFIWALPYLTQLAVLVQNRNSSRDANVFLVICLGDRGLVQQQKEDERAGKGSLSCLLLISMPCLPTKRGLQPIT